MYQACSFLPLRFFEEPRFPLSSRSLQGDVSDKTPWHSPISFGEEDGAVNPKENRLGVFPTHYEQASFSRETARGSRDDTSSARSAARATNAKHTMLSNSGSTSPAPHHGGCCCASCQDSSCLGIAEREKNISTRLCFQLDVLWLLNVAPWKTGQGFPRQRSSCGPQPQTTRFGIGARPRRRQRRRQDDNRPRGSSSGIKASKYCRRRVEGISWQPGMRAGLQFDRLRWIV